MFGSVTSYSGTTLIVNVTAIGTATSSSDWIISELVNDAANVYASGGVEPSVGYITTSGKVRFAGRLYHGMHGLCSTGPGSGTAVANFPAFRLPKTMSDDASSQLPGQLRLHEDRDGLKVRLTPIGSAVLLCTDKNAYTAGYAPQGANGDGTVVHAPNYKKIGSGTVMAATISGHVDDVWHVGLDNPAYIAQLDTNQCVGWGYGTPHVIPGQSAAIISTPVILAAPFDGTKRISKISGDWALHHERAGNSRRADD